MSESIECITRLLIQGKENTRAEKHVFLLLIRNSYEVYSLPLDVKRVAGYLARSYIFIFASYRSTYDIFVVKAVRSLT